MVLAAVGMVSSDLAASCREALADAAARNYHGALNCH